MSQKHKQIRSHKVHVIESSKIPMIISISKSMENFENIFDSVNWILELYTNIHWKNQRALKFQYDIWWKFLKIVLFFMCFTLLLKPKFTIDNLIRGMDRGVSLRVSGMSKVSPGQNWTMNLFFKTYSKCVKIVPAM